MSAPAQNLSLVKAVDFQIPPTSEVPQSSVDSVANINASTKAHVDLINATKGGRRPRRRRTSRRSYKGGVGGVGSATIPGDSTTIVVAPLPLGANTPNAQANNVAAATLFANAVTASKYDNAVTQPAVTKVGGGNKRRRTRRALKKRTQRRRRTKRRSMKYIKMMKSKKSRGTRRR
jgi:hypothetical protein